MAARKSANTSISKACRANDGHRHVMYRYKSPYAGTTGLVLDPCLGCGQKNQTDWWECIHCTRQRCHQCRLRGTKDPPSQTQWVEGAVPAQTPTAEYPGGRK